MIDLKTTIVLVFMTYIVDLDGYKLHPRDEKMGNNFFNEC